MSLVNKIKDLIKMEKEEEVKESFVDFKVTVEVDGESLERIFRVESEIAVDAKVEEVTEDGVKPVENGTFLLEDGRSIVLVDSNITEIVEAVEEEDKEEDKEVKEELDNVDVNEFEVKFNEVTINFSALTETNLELTSELEIKNTELETLKAEFEAFKKGSDEVPTEIKVKKEKMSKSDLTKFFGK